PRPAGAHGQGDRRRGRDPPVPHRAPPAPGRPRVVAGLALPRAPPPRPALPGAVRPLRLRPQGLPGAHHGPDPRTRRPPRHRPRLPRPRPPRPAPATPAATATHPPVKVFSGVWGDELSAF